jgi:rhodanese-related sulfurtransferase
LIFYTQKYAYSPALTEAELTGNGAAGSRMQIKISPLHRVRRSLAEIVRSSMLAAIKKLVRARFPDVPHLTTSQLADWLADAQRAPPLLLDVRSNAEFAVSHLPDARQIDPDSSTEEVMGKLPKDQPWVLYCSAGYRASHLAQRLLQAGATEVANLDGAIFSWVREGRELQFSGPEIQVHPYSRIAAKLLRPEHRASLSC